MRFFIFITFLLYSSITKILSARIFTHVVIIASSFFLFSILTDLCFEYDKKFSYFRIHHQRSRCEWLIFDDYFSLIDSTQIEPIRLIWLIAYFWKRSFRESWLLLLQMIYAEFSWATRVIAYVMLDFLLDWFKIT
jgi:hypothetical protein